ncbi:MAG: glutamyl-tRNA reductase [Gaiellaceae bacterium]|nr:glutamyl-tRNA reductase [Gaiellaceae bacterium]
MTLLAVGVSHRTASLALRERLHLTERGATELLVVLLARPGIEEAAALATCNRTELYLLARDARDAERAVTAELARAGKLPPAEIATAIQMLDGAAAARQLFTVAAGLDSMVVGEAEIQGQVSRAYQLALAAATSGRVVNRLFQDALRTGKRVRSETGVARHGASVASVAVAIAQREIGDLRGRRALVIGAGRHGALIARALTSCGAETIFVANRSHERAEELARRFAGTAVGFDDLAGELSRCDLVLTCTSCPQRVLTRDQLAAAARGRRLVVIDTAVPRDVEPSARHLAGVALYDLDAIQAEIARNLSTREAEARRAAPIVEEELSRFERWLASLEVVPTIAALRQRGDAAVERALRENEPRWQALSHADRERVALIARAVVSDLLHEPTLSLRRAGENGASSLYVQTVHELFGLTA